MNDMTGSKLIKKSQVRGLACSSADRRRATRLHVEQACREVYRTRRPAVDSVLREGAGRFSRASVEKPERHGHVLKLWQRTWDEQHPQDAARFAARSAKRAQPTPPSAASGGSDGSAKEGRIAAQLEAALVEIERLERQHLMDVELIGELRLSLRRAKAEPRPRLPRRYSGSNDDATQH